MSVGATLLVVGLAGPASAHGKQEPVPAPDKSCPELAEQFHIDKDLSEFDVTDFPEDDFTKTYTIDDRGTGDTSDDITVTVTVQGRKYVAWESHNISIDAVNVTGVNEEQTSAFYIYNPPETSDYKLGTNPWDQPDKNLLSKIAFCFEAPETPPTTVPPTTSSSVPETTSSSVPEETTTSVVESTTTSTTVMASTAPSSTSPPTTEAPGGSLPHTGSNTGVLVALGAGLLAIGGVLLATKRQIWRRFS
jgi:LPXTG-motif cell wall-anchored protein